MSFFQNLIDKLTGVSDKDEPITLPDNAVFIDVRSLAECASGTIKDALIIPVQNLSAEVGRQVPDKDTPILIYCASGMRSGGARRILLGMGYTNVTNTGSLHATARNFDRPIV